MPEMPIVDYGEARRIAIDGRLLVGVQGLHDYRRIGETRRPRVTHDTSDDTQLRRAWDEVYWWLSFAGPNEPLFKACLDLQAVAPDDPAVDWLAVIGPLEAGTYRVEYTVSWTQQIYDGYDYFGPGTNNLQYTGTCTFVVR